VRGQILRTRVGLSEERAGKVEAILDRNAPERRRLQGEIQAATKALRELMRANSQDQQAYARALEQLRAGQKALRNLREREDEAVRQVLKPREQALLLRSLENLRRKARAPAPPPRPRA
jgi:Spy/CpxP family protein refolding chaperone